MWRHVFLMTSVFGLWCCDGQLSVDGSSQNEANNNKKKPEAEKNEILVEESDSEESGIPCMTGELGAHVVRQGISVQIPLADPGLCADSEIAINPALPSGLSFDQQNGIINGIPEIATTTVTHTITVSVNSVKAGEATLTLTVHAMLPSLYYGVESLTLTKNVQMESVSPIESLRGALFSISPNLPQGLSFSEDIGTLSGTPIETLGSTEFEITARDDVETRRMVLHISVQVGCTDPDLETIYTNQTTQLCNGNTVNGTKPLPTAPAHVHSTSGVGSKVVTLPTHQAGDLLLVVIGHATATPLLSAPADWTQIDNFVIDPTLSNAYGSDQYSIYYKVAGNSEPASVTWSDGPTSFLTFYSWVSASFRGIASTPISTYAVGVDKDGTLEFPAVTAGAWPNLVLRIGVAGYSSLPAFNNAEITTIVSVVNGAGNDTAIFIGAQCCAEDGNISTYSIANYGINRGTTLVLPAPSGS